jgi:uncharacterized protein YdeI (YjbR/CyaY-like superfamily)
VTPSAPSTYWQGGPDYDIAKIPNSTEVIAGLGSGQRPQVKVKLNSYVYVTSVGKMNGKFMIRLSAAHRQAAGLNGDEEVDVSLELADELPPSVLPDDVASVFRAAGLQEKFDRSAPSRRKEWLRQIVDAKTPETRVRRIQKVVDELTG